MKLYGFTLAEVLITLTIIGVVAAVSVPTLTKKTGNQEMVTRLQKIYSVLSQATDEIMLEYGSPKNGWASSTENVYNLYKEHLRNSKECGISTGCFYDGLYKRLNGTEWRKLDEQSSQMRLVLADGTGLQFAFTNADCTTSNDGSNSNLCGEIRVDINGKKGPNQVGRDYFEFHIREDGIYPNGCDNDYKDCTSTGAGYNCACKVLNEGAINY